MSVTVGRSQWVLDDTSVKLFQKLSATWRTAPNVLSKTDDCFLVSIEIRSFPKSELLHQTEERVCSSISRYGRSVCRETYQEVTCLVRLRQEAADELCLIFLPLTKSERTQRCTERSVCVFYHCWKGILLQTKSIRQHRGIGIICPFEAGKICIGRRAALVTQAGLNDVR